VRESRSVEKLSQFRYVAQRVLPADSFPITNVIFWVLSIAVRIALFAWARKLRSELRGLAIADLCRSNE
jgi:hypothetical protein